MVIKTQSHKGEGWSREEKGGDVCDPHLEQGGVYEPGKLLVGEAPGHSNANQITLFKNNVGMGIQFEAVGARALDEARNNGLGNEIPTD